MKQHPIYKHLLISKTGEIYSTKTNKYLKVFKHKNGYLVFSTKLNGRASPGILLRVHRLVAETYVDNSENKPFVNHLNGNKLDNNKENLQWVTAKENSQHAWDTGLCKQIPRNENKLSKITTEQLETIRALYIPHHKTYGLRALAKQFKVAHSTLSRLLLG